LASGTVYRPKQVPFEQKSGSEDFWSLYSRNGIQGWRKLARHVIPGVLDLDVVAPVRDT